MQPGNKKKQTYESGLQPVERSVPGLRPVERSVPGLRPGEISVAGLLPGEISVSGLRPGEPSVSGLRPGEPSVSGLRPGEPSVGGVQPDKRSVLEDRPVGIIQTSEVERIKRRRAALEEEIKDVKGRLNSMKVSDTYQSLDERGVSTAPVQSEKEKVTGSRARHIASGRVNVGAPQDQSVSLSDLRRMTEEEEEEWNSSEWTEEFQVPVKERQVFQQVGEAVASSITEKERMDAETLGRGRRKRTASRKIAENVLALATMLKRHVGRRIADPDSPTFEKAKTELEIDESGPCDIKDYQGLLGSLEFPHKN